MDQRHLLSDVISERIQKNQERQDLIRCYFNEYLYLEEEIEELLSALKKYDIPLQQ
nr:hypothetical protein [uncultured Butyrivibrio sp.]